MSENIHHISYHGKEITLIATAHVSKESAELVKATIDELQPDSVCIELDQQRYQSLKNKTGWEATDISKVIKEGKFLYLIVNTVLSSYQRKIAEQLNTQPGQEMIEAIEAAQRINANLVLADRDIQLTFKRLWRMLTMKEKFRLLSAFLADDNADSIDEQDIDALLKSASIEDSISSLDASLPIVSQVILHERNLYLAEKIKNAPGTKVVAVIGAAHLPGVMAAIPQTIDISSLSQLPEKSRLSGWWKWLLPLAIVLLLLPAFIDGFQQGFTQLGIWALYNSSFAAFFTLLAGAHPLSILTAFVTAPFSALHPLVACGWFVALVEVKFKKPTVKDAQTILDDINSVKGWFKNRLLRILLCLLMANLGSLLGTLASSFQLFHNVF